MRLAGKAAIVTGAGQGGGMGAALALGAEGAAVLLFGRTRAKLEKVAHVIEARGGKTAVFAGDVTRPQDLQASIDLTLTTFGRLDILVNAAQSPEMRAGLLAEMDEASTRELWESGAAATLAFMKLVRPVMAGQGGGSIVNFGSGGEKGPAHYGVYAGVKAAIRTISRAAAVEWAAENIRVNVVVPMVMSPSLEADPTGAEALAKLIPLGRIGDPEKDIGRPIAFLVSEDASFITGCTLPLDGGLTYFS